MLHDDASWVLSLAESAQGDAKWEAPMGLGGLPQFARIAYEGLELLKNRHPDRAGTIALKFADDIAAARHTIKLFDDNQKFYDGVIADFTRIEVAHNRRFSADEDLAIVELGGRLISTSRIAAFQRTLVLDATGERAQGRGHTYNFGNEIGRLFFAVLMGFGLSEPRSCPLKPPVGPHPSPETTSRNDRYRNWFEPEFSLPVKDALTVVETHVNTALLLFAPSASDFPSALFRARFITAAHVLNALEEVQKRNPALAGRQGMSELSTLLALPQVERIRASVKLRNRCMHYGVPSHLQNLSPNRLGYGLVEATTSPRQTFGQASADILDVLQAASDLLRDWRNS
ncbi:hypothetical protein AB0K52_21870 [Glycomyces sp. NPDC049804]|uniref:hypothetical protein n=1 Tax=Glycomyces sp. NPDC049804 TaxID=3154363 RepID=UPI003417421B